MGFSKLKLYLLFSLHLISFINFFNSKEINYMRKKLVSEIPMLYDKKKPIIFSYDYYIVNYNSIKIIIIIYMG